MSFAAPGSATFELKSTLSSERSAPIPRVELASRLARFVGYNIDHKRYFV